ncbi:MAG: glycogen debranching protein, partial [Candidatus Lindowbacteria bacterium]|nr:glycogen debranching protein [Candidatus Lindowbacteria bacterium]
ITLGAVSNRKICRSILEAVEKLLIPGAIRTLADAPVKHQLPIYANHGGGLLNNPSHPYWGHYEGDEDTRRKPAYHNGTAWTWLFPSYPEAYFMTFGEIGKPTARAILSSSLVQLKAGCFGQIPEILDGNLPHEQRGCDAQAWGVTELYRVWKLLAD